MMVAQRQHVDQPIIHIPAAWLLSVTHGSCPHQKRKYMMLLQLVAQELSGAKIWITGNEEYLYGETPNNDSLQYANIALDQLESEGYIQILHGNLLLTDKTRQMFSLGDRL